MAPHKVEKTKRKNKRKVRTGASPSPIPSPQNSEPPAIGTSPSPPAQPAPQSQQPAVVALSNPQQAFRDFYLRQATREFANDLEKLREANDWNSRRGVDVLVEALGMGVRCFAESEREAIGKATAAGTREKN